MTDIEKQWPEFEDHPRQCDIGDFSGVQLLLSEYNYARCAIIRFKELEQEKDLLILHSDECHNTIRKLEEKNRKLGIMAEMGWLTARALLIKPKQDCTKVIEESLRKIEELKKS